eukprot:CAMPEP_0117666492 /NCGR_PEP_ID=MMETSP0804-20121206/10409_1 /TAXON_ID=1074897 /ORGANISM="Tetraselmis astigmatica, Strain CCMP880" /LENGTH=459 /DNA_ID=CAMNT_0005474049 /DNA_START=366 /DNA_END=1741 /DNA_ORIENTATION=+
MYGDGTWQQPPAAGQPGIWSGYDRELSTLLDEIPRATSAPPHLQDREGLPGLDPRLAAAYMPPGTDGDDSTAAAVAAAARGQYEQILRALSEQQASSKYLDDARASYAAELQKISAGPSNPASSMQRSASSLGMYSYQTNAQHRNHGDGSINPLSLLGDPQMLDRPRSAIDLTAHNALSLLSNLSLHDSGSSGSQLQGLQGGGMSAHDLQEMSGHLASMSLMSNTSQAPHQPVPSQGMMGPGAQTRMSNPGTPSPMEGGIAGMPPPSQYPGMPMPGPDQMGMQGSPHNAMAALAAAAAAGGGGMPPMHHMPGGPGMPNMHGVLPGMHGMPMMPPQGMPPPMQAHGQQAVFNTIEYQAAYQAAMYVQQQQAILMAQHGHMAMGPGQPYMGMSGHQQDHNVHAAAAAAAAQAAAQSYYPGGGGPAEPPLTPAGWLFTITRRTCLNERTAATTATGAPAALA